MSRVYKHVDQVARICERDSPSDRELGDPKLLCLEQCMRGRYVAVQWTHYDEDDAGLVCPSFLEIGHDGKCRPYYRLGLAEAKRWIRSCDQWIDTHMDEYRETLRKSWK